jgi:hypothetical protein
MPNLKAILVIPFLALSVQLALAQGSTAMELQQKSERIAVLESQLKELELENKVAQQASDLQQRGSASKKSSVDSNVDYGIPTVALVEGLKGSLESVLVYRGNVRQRVREGDIVYGAIVKKISINEVTLMDQKSKTQQRLQFGTASVVRDANSAPTVGAPLPLNGPVGYPVQR